MGKEQFVMCRFLPNIYLVAVLTAIIKIKCLRENLLTLPDWRFRIARRHINLTFCGIFRYEKRFKR